MSLKLKFIFFIVLAGLVSACGFQLRKENINSLPPELKAIKVNINGIKHAAELKNIFINEWQLAGGALTESSHVPALTIDGERVIKRVLSVSPADAKVSEYSLKYVLSFNLASPEKKELLISKKIYLQRQFTVDANNVLAKEHEQIWLTNNMRQQAVKQVVRKISHIDPALLVSTKIEQTTGKK